METTGLSIERRSINRTLLSLNIGSAIAFGIYDSWLKGLESEHLRFDLSYRILLATTRTADLLHFHIPNPLEYSSFVRTGPAWLRILSFDITFVLLICALSLTAFVGFQVLESSKRLRSLGEALKFYSIVFSFPLAFLIVILFDIGSAPPFNPGDERFLGHQILIPLVVAELTIAATVRFVHQRIHALSRLSVGLLLLLHYLSWWVVIFTDKLRDLPFGMPGPLQILIIAFPALTFFYWKTAYDSQNQQPSTSFSRTKVAIEILVSVSLLFFLFGPRPARQQVLKGASSAQLRLWRTPCFGMCPSYDLSIRGDGQVRYSGYSNVRVYDTQTVTLSPARTAEVFQLLNSSDYFQLDDRAFSWCFDTPRVGLSVTANGVTRSLESDGGCFWPKDGRQAKFVELTDKIARLVNTDQWVKCDDRPCRGRRR